MSHQLHIAAVGTRDDLDIDGGHGSGCVAIARSMLASCTRQCLLGRHPLREIAMVYLVEIGNLSSIFSSSVLHKAWRQKALARPSSKEVRIALAEKVESYVVVEYIDVSICASGHSILEEKQIGPSIDYERRFLDIRC